MLLIYGDPVHAAAMRNLPSCLCDSWTKELREDYPSLEGEEVVAVVQLAAMLQRADIYRSETCHCPQACLSEIVADRCGKLAIIIRAMDFPAGEQEA